MAIKWLINFTSTNGPFAEGEPQQMFCGNLQLHTFRLYFGLKQLQMYWEGFAVDKSIHIAKKPPAVPRLASLPSSTASYFDFC